MHHRYKYVIWLFHIGIFWGQVRGAAAQHGNDFQQKNSTVHAMKFEELSVEVWYYVQSFILFSSYQNKYWMTKNGIYSLYIYKLSGCKRFNEGTCSFFFQKLCSLGLTTVYTISTFGLIVLQTSKYIICFVLLLLFFSYLMLDN